MVFAVQVGLKRGLPQHRHCASGLIAMEYGGAQTTDYFFLPVWKHRPNIPLQQGSFNIPEGYDLQSKAVTFHLQEDYYCMGPCEECISA
jgi:hypothetical protein